MAETKLRGVIAAVATAVDEAGSPDAARSTKLARFLLDTGCDGLNVLGTTGEATSFSLDERKRVMDAYKAAGLPLDRMMVGTVWSHGGCRSWYQDPTGRVSALWPTFTFPFRRRLRRVDRAAYVPV